MESKGNANIKDRNYQQRSVPERLPTVRDQEREKLGSCDHLWLLVFQKQSSISPWVGASEESKEAHVAIKFRLRIKDSFVHLSLMGHKGNDSEALGWQLRVRGSDRSKASE